MTIGYSTADANEIFELQCEVFRRMTGFLAPGKDAPAASSTETSERDRWAAWDQWQAKAAAVAVRLAYITMKEQEWHDARTTE